MSRIRLALAATAASVAVVGLTVLPASPASAAASAPAAKTSASGTCFGYTGNFNDYGFWAVDWTYGPDECFGVAPSGTIWHTWSGAGGWKEMPGNGRALAVTGVFPENANSKTVQVVTSTGNYYCNTDNYATNDWSGWYGC
ncbi:hypothetical protein [Streptomyces sp. SPB162]|uniref:hypothetical protein n=1 Tax=Streptomyces sp. SPB162 TaxID=2940560 RepID=UPI00240775C8|nr:hypothetical protein [Streptomyces sp. SPB162]MDF9813248.1 hypothetical protein [Streptomyces sp. SPB162]